MKKSYFVFALLLHSILGFTQSAKIVKGVIVSDNAFVANVEIINVRTKNVVVSNEIGTFAIASQRNDLLVFIANGFLEKKLYLSSALLYQDVISVDIIRKTNELKEVVVTKEAQKLVTPVSVTYTSKINNYNTTMRANQTGVYTGETINGTDFIAIGKMIGKLFKRKQKAIATTNVDIKEYLSANFDEAFCAKVLELRQEQVISFFKFCEDDPKAQKILNEGTDFEITDFLISKNEAFKKK